jgi:glycosyltransferase involved in cell wall biosynthesis
MSYPDVFNPDLLARIPAGARLVVDVGCGSGALGSEYKRRNPHARVIGVEVDAASGAQASQRLDHVYVCDLDIESTPFANDIAAGEVDCLIYGDVLEHVQNPWNMLRKHIEYIGPHSVVLICCPNVEHWSFAERLLRGTWCYEDHGLFDDTHLRWFTGSAIKKLLRKLNLHTNGEFPRIFESPKIEEFVEHISPGLTKLGIDATDYELRASPLQYVWRAHRRRVEETLTIVSTALSPVGGVSDVRVNEPMESLKSDPRVTISVISGSDEPPDDVEGAKVFVFHRPLLAGRHGLERVKTLIDRGWIVVCEFDDHPDYIPVLQRPDVHNFRAVHAIQTTTETLSDVLKKRNPEVRVFENAVARLPDIKNFSNQNKMTFLFAGLNREEEWPPYLDTLNASARKFEGRIFFDIINDRHLFDALATNSKSFTPLCDYHTYRSILSRSDISFMPLSDSPFNNCKSDLKFIEAAACRVAALASPIVYQRTIDDGRSGLIFNTPEELDRCITLLLTNPEYARQIGDAARRYVEQRRMLSYQISDRVEWYLSLWERRDALSRSLLTRAPELQAIV